MQRRQFLAGSGSVVGAVSLAGCPFQSKGPDDRRFTEVDLDDPADVYRTPDPVPMVEYIKRSPELEYHGIPLSELKVVEEERGCDNEAHYHPAEGNYVTTADCERIPEPDPECGFGKVAELEHFEASLTDPCWGDSRIPKDNVLDDTSTPGGS